MSNTACCFFDLIVEAMQQGHFVNLVIFSLDSKLALPIVTSDENLALLCHHDGTLLSTTNAFNDHIFRVQALENRSCWLEDCLNMSKACSSELARPPSVDVATVCNKSAVRATTLDLDWKMVLGKGLRVDQYWRIRRLNRVVSDTKLAGVVAAERENLICCGEECCMMIATRQLLNDDVEGERVGDVVRQLLHFFVSLGRVFLCEAQLAELVAAPGEKLCILWSFAVPFCLYKLKACSNFAIVNHLFQF